MKIINKLFESTEIMYNDTIINNDCIFRFNLGITPWKNNMYLLPYRIVVTKNKQHPWLVWSHSFCPEFPKDYSRELDVFKLIDFASCNIIYDNNFNCQDYIYDSTGLLIVSIINNKIIKLFDLPNIFGTISNYDTRIYNFKAIIISYNTLFKDSNNELISKMCYRELIIDIDKQKLVLGNESLMYENPFYEFFKIEKNWVFINDRYILYLINKSCIIFDTYSNTIYSSNIHFMSHNIMNHMFFSLSSPLLLIDKNSNLYLGAGHLKVDHRYCNNTNFKQFMTQYNTSNIILHGAYVYFIFFYILNFKTKNIIKISHAYITDNSKYLLEFPIGLCEYKNNIICSYGIGDEFSCLINLPKTFILNNLLYNIDMNTHNIFDFKLLNYNDVLFDI
jgi:hypothetical protein